MMKTITVTELHSNIYDLLDEVLATGIPLIVKKGNQKLRIESVEQVDKLQNLIYRPDAIQGEPEDLVHIEWADTANSSEMSARDLSSNN